MPIDELPGIEADYLAYIVGPEAQFLWSKEFAAANDDAAIEIARKFGVYVESSYGAENGSSKKYNRRKGRCSTGLWLSSEPPRGGRQRIVLVCESRSLERWNVLADRAFLHNKNTGGNP
jgi:hypothetical protein